MPRLLAPSLDALRRHAVCRSLFNPTTLPQALQRLGFLQADPIRAPARAQDLVLRHRVRGYRAGDLERRYPRLDIEEDAFVNYGFVPRSVNRLMHPRQPLDAWPAARERQARAVLDFVRAHGTVHPQQVDAAFAHGKALNWFGGTSKASTQLLDAMHYRGWLRIAGRAGGVRLYAVRPEHPPTDDPVAAMDALVDVVMRSYAPLPEGSLSTLISRLRYGAPQWEGERRAAFARAKRRFPSARVEGCSWYWPEGEQPGSRRHAVPQALRLLAPFDPVVWDRPRFERLWGWAYRFEAYTPAPLRQRGYYALPMLWRDQVIGWANLDWRAGVLQADIGHVSGTAPREPAYRRALDEELARMSAFLGGA